MSESNSDSNSKVNSSKLDFTKIIFTCSIEGKADFRKTHWFLTYSLPSFIIENVNLEFNSIIKILREYRNMKQMVAQMENSLNGGFYVYAAITLNNRGYTTTVKDFMKLLPGIHIEYSDRDATPIRRFCSKTENRVAGPVFIGFSNEKVGKLKYIDKWNEEKTKKAQDPVQKITQQIFEKCDAKILENNIKENMKRKLSQIIKIKQDIKEWEEIAEEDLLDIKNCSNKEYQHFADELERTEGMIAELKAKLENLENEPNSDKAPEVEENPDSRKERMVRQRKRSWKQWNKDFKKRMNDNWKHLQECSDTICDFYQCVKRRKEIEENEIRAERNRKDALFMAQELEKVRQYSLKYSLLSKEEKCIHIKSILNLLLAEDDVEKEEDFANKKYKKEEEYSEDEQKYESNKIKIPQKKKKKVIIVKNKVTNDAEKLNKEYSLLSEEDRIIFAEFLKKRKKDS
jgi:hypothetical protein